MGFRSLTDGILFTAGLALVVGTLVGSALLAPSLTEKRAGDAETLVASQGGGTQWAQDGSVALLDGSTTAWRSQTANSHFEVERLGNDTLVTAILDRGHEQCGRYTTPCPHTGFHVLDTAVAPFEGPVDASFTFPIRSAKNSEVHAVEPLPDGGMLVADMEYERVLAVENGTVTWQWNASSFYDAPPDPTGLDWLHINDVAVIAEGRYLVSVRNANQLLVLERGDGVVEVINADESGSDASCTKRRQLADYDGDGDVRCGDPGVLNHQHNPHWLGDGAILVADSGNDRLVELHRRNGTWEPTWVLRGANGVPFHWPRDADRLPNGNTLITDTLNKRVLEVDRSGTVVWSVRTAQVPYEADRLPFGERAGVPTFTAETADTRWQRLPLLADAIFFLRVLFPWLPYWFRGLQLLATAVGACAMLAGLTIRYW